MRCCVEGEATQQRAQSEYSFTSPKIIQFVLDVMLWHQRLSYASFFNKLVSRRILYVEKSVDVLIDEINSLVENDA